MDVNVLNEPGENGGELMGQTERIFYILNTLRRDNRLRAEETAHRFEVSVRTVKRDLEYIRDRLEYDLLWSAAERHYYLSRGDLEKVRQRGEQELLFYSLAMGFCRNRQLMPLVSRSIEEHLAGLLPPEYRELSEHISYGLFDSPEPPPRFFSLILRAISSRRQMHLDYTSLRGTRSERRIDPLHLKNWNGQWYLAAWCHKRGEIRLFHLNRINELALLGELFVFPMEEGELKHRMERGFGIMAELNGDRPETWVTLRFTGRAAQLTEGVIWHPSQRHRWEEGRGEREFTFPVSSYEEVLNRVFSYRDEAEVVEPEELRRLWKDTIGKMSRKYL